MKLDVYSNDTRIGSLEQVDLTSFVFRYLPGVEDRDAVSLLMLPSVKTEWEHRFLHPVFQVSLPEGILRQTIVKTNAKKHLQFGDTEILATIGSHLVGRIKVTPAGEPLQGASPVDELNELMCESETELLDQYLHTHANFSGVSGAFGKYLSKSPVLGTPSGHTTLAFDHWIVKHNDEDHKDIVFNEFYSMTVAKRMGIPVPEFISPPDFSKLIIKRFDVVESEGSHPSRNSNRDHLHLGFEDMCALMGLNADQKFSGSVERVLKSINSFCAPARAKRGREQFFDQYLACMALRNGDAHLKNFGLIYSGPEDVRLAPAYDIVSSSVYAPALKRGVLHEAQTILDADDEPSMSLNGVRRWLDERALQYLAARCSVNQGQIGDAGERLAAAMLTTGQEMAEHVSTLPEKAAMAKRMLELWSRGIRLHCQGTSEALAQFSRSIETDRPVYEPRPVQKF